LEEGDAVYVTATGTVDLAVSSGHYETDPDGLLTDIPDPGSGAESFFTAQSPPGSLTLGGFKLAVASTAQLPGARFGQALIGISANAGASSPADFPHGFMVVGSEDTFVTQDSGYLYAAVNDTNRTDNAGALSMVITVGFPMLVPAIEYSVPIGLEVAAGTRVVVSAGDFANLAAFDGPYVVGPDGMISEPPAPEAGSYEFFSNLEPVGPPMVGGVKFLPGSHVETAPVGSLVGGVSSSSGSPPGTFFELGTDGSFVATQAGHVHLAVNDANSADNALQFAAFVFAVIPPPSAVPVAPPWAIAFLAGALSLIGITARRTMA
jgi:hypothetical protein